MDQITTYATLQSAVAGFIHRDTDTSITANVPLCIQLCEAELSDRLLLKNSESDEALTLTTSANYVALPSGFVSPIAFWLVVDGVRVPVDFTLPQHLPYYTENSQPQLVAVDGANLRFDCPASQGYGAYLRCIKTSNLSNSNTSNYLLTRRPDLYLWGTLKQVGVLTSDDALLNKASGLYEAAIVSLKASENRSRSAVNLRTELCGGGRSNILIGE